MPHVRQAAPILAALTAAALSPCIAQRQSPGRLPPAPSYNVTPASGAITIDGRLDEPAWNQATRVPLDWEWFPGDNVPPPVATDCWITYDTSNLYIACLAHDPDPSAIRAHFADRDDLERTVQDDHIIILLDPFADQRRGFQFRVNAVGVQMDAFFSTTEGIEDFAWDAIWRSAGRITDEGYVVEVAIPFRSLRFPQSSQAQTWGVILERSYPRSSRYRIRSAPTDRSNSCLLCQANQVSGFQDISPGTNVELYPTVTARRTDTRESFPDGPIVTGDPDFHPGLDVRWGITPSLSLNATANPDFSQVEADVAQLDVNTRFALYYPEKRPFFLEGADIFETPVSAVFTRTVADPAGGLKFSGKAGANGIGFFAAYDRSTNLLFPANQGSSNGFLADSSFTAVARFRRDFGGSSALGVLYTGRETFDGYHNRVTGADAFWQVSGSNTLRIQALGSVTQYPDSTAAAYAQPTGEFTGGAVSAQFQHITRNWFGNLEYREFSPEFRADAGFVPRVNQRTVEGAAQRTFWGPRGSWFTQLQAGLGGEATLDYDGTLTDRRESVFFGYLGPSQATVNGEADLIRTQFQGVNHDLVIGALAFGIRPSGALRLGTSASMGDRVDFSNNRKAFSVTVQPSAEISIGRPVTLHVSHVFQRLSVGNTQIFTANLFQVRGFYHFSTVMFVRAIVQYQNVDLNPAAYTVPVGTRQRSLFTQLLFSYKLNPQTVAFVGYSDNRSGDETVALTTQGRTFFVKLGYAIRP